MSERPLGELWQAAQALGCALTLSSVECIDGRSRPRLLAVVKPASGQRWKTRSLRLRHGAVLASVNLQNRPALDDAAGVLLDVLAPLLAELRRRETA